MEANTVLDEAINALRRNDLQRAEASLAAAREAGVVLPPESLLRLAELNLRRRRWRDAAWFYSQIPAPLDTAAAMQHRLARNLDALERHRPDVYATLMALPAHDDVGVAPALGGAQTVVVRRADGSMLCLSAANDPLGASRSAMAQLRPVLAQGQPIGLCGVGDGYLLGELAHDRTPLFLTMQQPVFVIEPDARVLFHCLTIHDFTGPDGPIEQARFVWFVGPSWSEQLEQAVLGDRMLGCPLVNVTLGLDGPAVQAKLRSLVETLGRLDTEARERIERNYRTMSSDELCALMSTNPPRKPRVLLLTTRFSTVLQYSTRDTARAFEQLGWDAHVLIEPTPHHRTYRTAMRAALDAHQPDLVFQIDHLRHEHGDLFPANLPFACWIQDHLPHLRGEAGRHVGPRDFVLTDAIQTYVRERGYPERQCIAMPKLSGQSAVGSGQKERGHPDFSPAQGFNGSEITAATIAEGEKADVPFFAPRQESGLPSRSRVGSAEADPTDVIFVSNASRTPAALLAEALEQQADPRIRNLMAASAERMDASFATAEPLATYFDIEAMLREVMAEQSIQLDGESIVRLGSWLYHPYCDAHYRQQALRWAAAACGELRLTLSLYGKGWESHPDLSVHARGPLYGEALQGVSRRAAINLQIVPYFCLHQRLLDAVSGGAFMLIRRHLTDVAPQAMSDLLHEHSDPTVRDLNRARATLPPRARDRFEALLRDCMRTLCPTRSEDPIAGVRHWEDAGLLVPGAGGVLPRIDEVMFHDRASLKQRIARFAKDADARREIADAQRASISGRLTYVAGIRRMLESMRETIASEGSPMIRQLTAGQIRIGSHTATGAGRREVAA